MVKEISSASEFETEIRGPGLVVVDYFATWCGPCRMMAPVIEDLSRKYPAVKFLKVDSDKNQDICGERQIRSLPTFHFFVNGRLIDEMMGANAQGLEAKVVQHKVEINPWAGKGVTLAGSAGANDNVALDPREARLRALGVDPSASRPPRSMASSAVSDGAVMAVDEDEDEELIVARAVAESLREAGKPSSSTSVSAPGAKPAMSKAEAQQDALDHAEAVAQMEMEQEQSGGAWDEEMVPVPVDTELLGQLIDMGFTDTRARKGIVHGKDLEGALGWLAEHENDPDIDQPYMVLKADGTPKAPLTAEEKAKRVEELKDKVKKRREEKARLEKAEEIRKEKERRERGQMMGETQEERDRMMRKREAEKQKKEKEAAKLERERLRAEIARDKELRKLNKGVLPSVLGVEGYNPSIVQYEVPSTAPAAPAGNPVSNEASTAKPAAVPPSGKSDASAGGVSAEQRIDSAIQTIMRYRTAGDGGNALKLLLTFVKNVAENPDDPKYRSINTESNAFKSKLTPLVGPVALLKALGFEKNEEEGKLKLEGDINLAIFSSTLTKLTQAELTYRQMNS